MIPPKPSTSRNPGAISQLGEIRATRASIDLDAIEGNVRALRAELPDSSQLMAVVKADGYGHGAPWIANAALSSGATLLGVATVSEGKILRAHGLEARIVILGSIDASEVAGAVRSDLEVTVADETLLQAVQRVARELLAVAPVPVHLKIDTGLRRYGAVPELAVALSLQIAADPYLRFASAFTHFASADEPDEPFTRAQLQEFERAVGAMVTAGLTAPPLHAANSAGVLTGTGTHFDIARPGIALYGVPPSAEVPLKHGMRPALGIESRITRLIQISPGDTVGYNRTFHAVAPAKGALVPIGYADGYRRTLSGRGWVGLHGRKAAVLGRISMDQIVVEVPRGVEVSVGDTVHVLGGEPSLAAPSILEMADLMDTNAYEVIVGMRSRMPRVFVRDGEPVAVRCAGDPAVAVS